MKRLAVMGILVLVLTGACSSDEPEPQASSIASAEPTDDATDAPTAPPSSAPEPSGTALLEDGRHAAYITEVNFESREITVDVIQFLMGDEADKAYQEDYGGNEPVENDYYIRNENPRLRTMIVAEDATVEVIWQEPDEDGDRADPDAIEFSDLKDYLDDRPGKTPFWLEVEDDTVTSIEEQYVP